jgi:hypothetical protein
MKEGEVVGLVLGLLAAIAIVVYLIYRCYKAAPEAKRFVVKLIAKPGYEI